VCGNDEAERTLGPSRVVCCARCSAMFQDGCKASNAFRNKVLQAVEDTKINDQSVKIDNRVEWLVYRYFDHIHPKFATAKDVINVERIEDSVGTESEIQQAMVSLHQKGILKQIGLRYQFLKVPERTFERGD